MWIEFIVSVPCAATAGNVFADDDPEEGFKEDREAKPGAVWYEAADETGLFRWL